MQRLFVFIIYSFEWNQRWQQYQAPSGYVIPDYPACKTVNF
jgi:hypothetical protein